MFARWTKDDRGFVLGIVAMLLFCFAVLLAYMLNVGGLLLARTRLQGAAELAASAAGRVVAETIANRASENVSKGLVAPPRPGQVNEPEIFLTPADRHGLQTDPAIFSLVERAAVASVQKNNPANWKDLVDNLVVEYPATENACNGAKMPGQGNSRTVEVRVSLSHAEPYLIPRIAANLNRDGELELSASSFYSVPLCP